MQLPCGKALHVCLAATYLLLIVFLLGGWQSTSRSQRLDYQIGLSRFTLSREIEAVRQDATPYVPDVHNYTADVLPEVAKAVLQLEQQGKGRKVIAVSLYGADTRYTQGAVENALLAKRDWQGWTYRVYFGAGVPADVLNAIKGLGGELVNMTAQGSTQGNVSSTSEGFWRFLALTDPSATRIICRDADARLSARDKAAVSEWMASGYLFHIMHDHPWQGVWPILSGMFGTVNGLLRPQLIQKWFQQDHDVAKQGSNNATVYKWYADQDWLTDTIWPLVKDQTLSHSSFYCGQFGEAKTQGFPTQRASAFDFVGNVYKLNNTWQGEALPPSWPECPQQCRRKPEWLTC